MSIFPIRNGGEHLLLLSSKRKQPSRPDVWHIVGSPAIPRRPAGQRQRTHAATVAASTGPASARAASTGAADSTGAEDSTGAAALTGAAASTVASRGGPAGRHPQQYPVTRWGQRWRTRPAISSQSPGAAESAMARPGGGGLSSWIVVGVLGFLDDFGGGGGPRASGSGQTWCRGSA